MLAMKSLSFGLRPKPPFRLDLTAWALRRRGHNIVDLWDATTYQRVLEIGGIPLKVAVRQVGSSEHPRLHVSVTGRQISRDAKNRGIRTCSNIGTEDRPYRFLCSGCARQEIGAACRTIPRCQTAALPNAF
jgi:hypothetical protein